MGYHRNVFVECEPSIKLNSEYLHRRLSVDQCQRQPRMTQLRTRLAADSMFRRSAPPTCQGLAEYQLSDVSGTLGKNGQPSGSVVGVQSQMELCDILVLFFVSRQNLENFGISHAFLPLTVAKLSTLKNSPVFIDPPRIVAAILAELRLVTDRQTDTEP